jgi:hypothetical protein
LKKILYILLFIVGFQFNLSAQTKTLIKSEVENTVKFYPNPAISYINFEFEKDYNNTYSLIIYNFLGKKVLEHKLGDRKINIPVTNFFRGIYIFQLSDQQGKVIESGKFQVSK